MPYTYLAGNQYTAPTGHRAIDESLATLRKITGWDYRVCMNWEYRGWLRKSVPVFSIYVPCGITQFGGEFGIEDFDGHMTFHAPEKVALAFLEGLHWGALDERQRAKEKPDTALDQAVRVSKSGAVVSASKCSCGCNVFYPLNRTDFPGWYACTACDVGYSPKFLGIEGVSGG